jgi:hypothetical protein
MKDLAALFFVVVVIYLSQCLCWAPVRAVVFSLEAEGKKGRRKTGFSWSALNLVAYWCNPLPFLEPVMAVYWPGFQPGPEGLLLQTDQGSSLTTWEELRLSRSGTKLLCNDVVVFQGSPDQLKACQDFLQAVKTARLKDRKKLIEKWLEKSVDASAAAARLKLFREKSSWLEVAANMEFFLLFVLVPTAFVRFGSRALLPSVAALLTLAIFIAWRGWKLHQAFYPLDNESRWKALFSTILSPISAARAMDGPARDILAAFHPITVAGIVCTREELESFAGQDLRSSRHSPQGESWYVQQLHLLLAGMLKPLGVDSGRLLGAPDREDGCLLYCPRCRAQFNRVRESCSDCGYEHLEEFQSAVATTIAPGSSR